MGKANALHKRPIDGKEMHHDDSGVDGCVGTTAEYALHKRRIIG